MDRITLIHKSMTTFICGLIGLWPLLGFPFGIAALVQFVSLRRRKTTDWNPAGHYLDWGARFALIGFVLTLIVVAIIFLSIINQASHSGWNGGYGRDD